MVNIAAQHRSLHILCFHFLSHFFFFDSLYIPIIFCPFFAVCFCIFAFVVIVQIFFCLASLLFFYLTATSEEESIKMCRLKSKWGHWLCYTSCTSVAFWVLLRLTPKELKNKWKTKFDYRPVMTHSGWNKFLWLCITYFPFYLPRFFFIPNFPMVRRILFHHCLDTLPMISLQWVI